MSLSSTANNAKLINRAIVKNTANRTDTGYPLSLLQLFFAHYQPVEIGSTTATHVNTVSATPTVKIQSNLITTPTSRNGSLFSPMVEATDREIPQRSEPIATSKYKRS